MRLKGYVFSKVAFTWLERQAQLYEVMRGKQVRRSGAWKEEDSELPIQFLRLNCKL